MSGASESSAAATEEQLAEWVEKVLPQALAYARSLVRDLPTAEDLVHDCLCRLLDRAADYALIQDGWRLLLRSISNAAIDRARKIEPNSFDAGWEREGPTTEPIDRKSLDPQDAASHNELQVAIENGLQRLPMRQRAAIELKSLGLPLSEIAIALEVSESNAGVLLHRARAAMAVELSPWLDGELS